MDDKEKSQKAIEESLSRETIPATGGELSIPISNEGSGQNGKDPSSNLEENSKLLKEHSGRSSSTRHFKETLQSCTANEEDDELQKRFEVVKCKIVNVMVMIHWFIFFCLLGCLLAALFVAKLSKLSICGVRFWKWCVFVMVVFCGMLMIKLLISLITFVIKKFWKNTKALFFVHGLRKSVGLFVWILSVFLVWICLIDRGIKKTKSLSMILSRVSWTMVSLVLGSFLLVLKTLLLKLLVSKFQIHAYLDRIKETLFVQYAFDVLSGPPLIENALTKASSFNDVKVVRSSRDAVQYDVRKLLDLKLEKISPWTVKKLVYGVTNLNIYINSHDSEAEDDVMKIHSEFEAKMAAKKIFMNVAGPGSRYIEEDDLVRFMMKDEVDSLCSQIPEFEEQGKISRSAWKNFVVNAFRERRALALALTDTKVVLKQLSKLLSAIVAVVTVVIWILALKITSPETIAIFLTAVAFTFGNTLKSVFEAAVFVFVVHPFDVGDRCVIDGTQMMVEEMGILTTVFLKADNEKIYYPNAVLATKPIGNFYRSPDMGESVTFTIDFATPVEKIEALKAKINRYVESKPTEWYPLPLVVIKEKENEPKLQLAVYCTHKMNFQDNGQRYVRRSELVIAMKKMFEELDIQYEIKETGSETANKQLFGY